VPVVVKSGMIFRHKHLDPDCCGDRRDDRAIVQCGTYQNLSVILVRFG